jgi:hypothetical protein
MDFPHQISGSQIQEQVVGAEYDPIQLAKMDEG